MLRFVLLLLLLLPAVLTFAQSDDIPDNCEFAYGGYYRPAIFPRYEPANRRLVMVDWTTGAEVGVLATDLDDTLIRAWSGSCRYLAVATGSYESRTTAVYDTVEMRYIGGVPGAYAAAHPLTWGPHDFLMVEGREGAVLWNVPANVQYPLAVGFNTTTYRNFSRLRWDAENRQVIANFANGGQAVYDLTTGQPTILADSRPGELILGGERFVCQPDRYGRNGARVDRLWLNYARSGGVVSIGGLVTLDANLPGLVGGYGNLWSINCRYIVGHVLSTERADTYDTYIWDVLAGRRVGVFPDARDVVHPVVWDTAETHLLVSTRDGAYLWNLETDARVLVNEVVSVPPGCNYECPPFSFHSVYWDAGRDQMLGVPVQSPDSVVAYDVHTGAEMARYSFEGAAQPVEFITSNDSRLLVLSSGGDLRIWDRETGAMTPLQTDYDFPYRNFAFGTTISTDNRYLVIADYNQLSVWDLTALTPNAPPTSRYQPMIYGGLMPVYFVNGDTVSLGYQGQGRLNVVTGEVFGAAAAFDPQTQQTQAFTALPGTPGYGRDADPSQADCPRAARYEEAERQLWVRNLDTGEDRLIEADLNPFRLLLLSPDCQTIYAEVMLLNTSLPYDETPGQAPYDYRRYSELIFWDVETGERIATLDDPPGEKFARSSRVWWSPDGDRALARTGSGHYLLHPASRTVAPVRFQDSELGELPALVESYWDMARGVVLLTGFGEVFAVDMQTGVERLRFPAREGRRGGCYNSVNYGCGISIDGSWVFVYGDQSMSAWNLNTLANVTVPVETPGNRMDGGLVSPDGRYLIVARSAVRVWDTAALPDDFDARQPVAIYGVGGSDAAVRFFDSTTLEVTLAGVVTYHELLTGAVVR